MNGILVKTQELSRYKTAEQERENPKPLTLEQLKKRVGKPVYIVIDIKSGCGSWKIIKDYIYSINPGTTRFIFTDDDMKWEHSYNDTWTSYDHEPKGEEE